MCSETAIFLDTRILSIEILMIYHNPVKAIDVITLISEKRLH